MGRDDQPGAYNVGQEINSQPQPIDAQPEPADQDVLGDHRAITGDSDAMTAGSTADPERDDTAQRQIERATKDEGEAVREANHEGPIKHADVD